MFFVINKEKVYAYVVSLFTIVTLFFMSNILNSEFNEVKETATDIKNEIVNTNIVNEENNVN